MRERWDRLRGWWATAASSVQFHRSAKWLWTVLIPVSYVLRDVVAWVTFMSHYAIITGHWSSEEAAMASVVGDRELAEVLQDIVARLARIEQQISDRS